LKKIDRISRILEAITAPQFVSKEDFNLVSYSKDGDLDLISAKELHNPSIVVLPETTEQVSKIVSLANKERIPVTPWGGGTNLAGAAIALEGGIVIDMKRMNNIIQVDEESFIVSAQAGITIGLLEEELSKQNLMLGHDLSSFQSSTLGGSISMSSIGYRAQKYGDMRTLVLGLEVVLPSGEIIRTRAVQRSASGYALNQLFVGSEGTLGIITEATLRVSPLPEAHRETIIAFDSFQKAFDASTEILKAGIIPAVHQILVPTEAISAKKKGILIVAIVRIRFEGLKENVLGEYRRSIQVYSKNGGIALGARKARDWWQNRHRAIRLARSKARRKLLEFSLPLGSIKKIFVLFQKTLTEHGFTDSVIMIPFLSFSIISVNIFYDEENRKQAELCKRASDELVKIILNFGGTMTSADGVGIRLKNYMKSEHGSSLKIMKKIKRALDPNNIMNPGIMFA
jgi:glycolate oxidase